MLSNTIGKRRVLVATLADPSGNPRPFRTIWLLNKLGYEVWTLSPRPKETIPGLNETLLILPATNSILARSTRKLSLLAWKFFGLFNIANGLSEYAYWFAIGGLRHLKLIQKSQIDLIIVEDLNLLNNLLRFRNSKTKIIFDAREYASREFESNLLFRVFDKPRINFLLTKCIPLLDGFYTVCDSLASEYEKDFGRLPKVVRSTPFYYNGKPNLNVLSPIRMVHHGNANSDRGLEKMIEVIKNLSGLYYLDFYLVGNKKNINYLKSVSEGCEWIKFKSPIPFNDLVDKLSEYDLGFYLLQPTGFNTKYALPNKFFEFIQAKLGVIVGPSVEMKKLVIKYSCGAVSNDFTVNSMVSLLKKLNLNDIRSMKEASNEVSKFLCWEKESEELKNIIYEVIN